MMTTSIRQERRRAVSGVELQVFEGRNRQAQRRFRGRAPLQHQRAICASTTIRYSESRSSGWACPLLNRCVEIQASGEKRDCPHLVAAQTDKEQTMGILWTIVIGFVAGVIAKFIMPGSNEPSGFVLTTILGIVGAVVASYLGQALGWYAPGEGAGLVGAIVGALVVLFVWGIFAKRRA
jgi:uncharacterized membrane protein YeaQ/YmgE (transglycosylase-associated protein family)